MKPNLIKLIDIFFYWPPFKAELSDSTPSWSSTLTTHIRKFVLSQLPNFFASSSNLEYSKVLISVHTKNQIAALEPLTEFINEHTIFSTLEGYKRHQFAEGELSKYAGKYFFHLIVWYFQFNKKERNIYLKRFRHYYYLLGIYRFLINYFNSPEKPLLYIASNDHRGPSQVGFIAAQNSGVRTLYIQHASVSKAFPPLKVDFALLDGEDSADKYYSPTSTTRIALVGAMKYDKYLAANLHKTKGEIFGICLSDYYCNFDKVKRLCELMDAQGHSFEIRTHPALSSKNLIKFYSKEWTLSDGRVENSLDFILRCHTIISGDSTILLDSLVLGRRSIYFSSDGSRADYYGYYEKGMFPKIYIEPEEVLSSLTENYELSLYRSAAKHFNSVIGTQFEGKSGQLAWSHIESIMENGQLSTKWHFENSRP